MKNIRPIETMRPQRPNEDYFNLALFDKDNERLSRTASKDGMMTLQLCHNPSGNLAVSWPLSLG